MTALRVALMSVDAHGRVRAVRCPLDRPVRRRVRASWRRAGVDATSRPASTPRPGSACLWVFGLYRLRARWSLRSEVGDVLRAATLLAVATFSALFVVKLPDVSRLFLLILFPAQVVLTVADAGRASAGCSSALRDRGYNLRYMLVVGAGRAARRSRTGSSATASSACGSIGHLATTRRRPRSAAGRSSGTVDDSRTSSTTGSSTRSPICLPRRRLGCIERDHPAVRGGGQDRPDPDRRSRSGAAGRPASRTSTASRSCSLVYGPDRDVGARRQAPARHRAVGLALLVLARRSSLILAIAMLVLDGRPILFRQTRVGLHGRPFKVVKFRTMVPDAEDAPGRARGPQRDQGPRLQGHQRPAGHARSGGFLRATSLDELPQLWNVLRGEMSLVGPRPPLPREVAGYDLWHRRRLSMKPGITGLWQVARPPGRRLRPLGRARPRLHRPLVGLARPQDHAPDDPGDAPGPLTEPRLQPRSATGRAETASVAAEPLVGGCAYRLAFPNRSTDSLASASILSCSL